MNLNKYGDEIEYTPEDFTFKGQMEMYRIFLRMKKGIIDNPHLDEDTKKELLELNYKEIKRYNLAYKKYKERVLLRDENSKLEGKLEKFSKN